MIPAQAVEAALVAWSKIETRTLRGRMHEALEAAAPHMVQAAYYLGLEHGANQPTNPYRSKVMTPAQAEFMPVTDAEYALIRNHLPEDKRPVFDRVRETGERLGDVMDDKTRYITAWTRAVQLARRDGLTRNIRTHDLRHTKAHEIYGVANGDD